MKSQVPILLCTSHLRASHLTSLSPSPGTDFFHRVVIRGHNMCTLGRSQRNDYNFYKKNKDNFNNLLNNMNLVVKSKIEFIDEGALKKGDEKY